MPFSISTNGIKADERRQICLLKCFHPLFCYWIQSWKISGVRGFLWNSFVMVKLIYFILFCTFTPMNCYVYSRFTSNPKHPQKCILSIFSALKKECYQYIHVALNYDMVQTVSDCHFYLFQTCNWSYAHRSAPLESRLWGNACWCTGGVTVSLLTINAVSWKEWELRVPNWAPGSVINLPSLPQKSKIFFYSTSENTWSCWRHRESLVSSI